MDSWFERLGPNPDGELVFRVAAEPASIQSRPAARAVFEQSIRAETRKIDYIIEDKVGIDVTWFVEPLRRWETDELPDLDNWLKPLLDGLSGPDGVMIDDSQVCNLSVSWTEGTVNSSTLSIVMRFTPEKTWPKATLRFVQFEGGLCTLIPPEVANDYVAAELWVKAYSDRLATVGRLRDIAHGSSIWPLLSQFVHRTRLKGFRVDKVDDFLAGLRGVGLS
jgi:Holliday junction resolvase RusA-like endonuclease